MFRLKSFLTIFTIFAVFLLAACGNSKDQAEGNKAEDKKKETSYTIEHAMGTTELKKRLKEWSF